MEGSAYTEPHHRHVRAAEGEHPNVGLCLQAYLRRTPATSIGSCRFNRRSGS